MGSYSVILKPAVEKDLRALPRKCLREFWRSSVENEPLSTSVSQARRR